MTHSENATKLIERFEGLETTSYRDQRDIWTIGYGHTAGVTAGMVYTQQQADQALASDLLNTETYVDNAVAAVDNTRER